MADFAASAAANAVGNLATEYASPYLTYFFRYGKITQDFKNQRRELELKKDRVKNDVHEAQRQAKVIEKDVESWISMAEKELRETKSLEDDIDRIKCSKWCPNWGWRCCLSKNIARKTLIISKLVETCNFSPVGRRAPLQGIEFITSKDFMDSESSKSALKEIMEAVNAKDVNMIGLYGMPGVGKTTLAKEVGKNAREQKLFDKIVMFTLSQNPNISKIQDKVADMFGLKFAATSEEGKAEELLLSMQVEKNILVIVDDLWEEFRLETIGIPMSCKILLTTRDQKVCTVMNCQKQIQLGILSEEEGWGLFKVNAGLEDGSSTLNDVAKEVASECKGLPLAIVTVAKALKGESLEVWRAANQRLKQSRHLDNEQVFGDVFRLLQLSYDYLNKNSSQTTQNDIQSCFLLCSLFPEDHEIFLEILIMCGIGVGLFSNVVSIEDKRREIGVAVAKLLKSGLLLEADDGRRVRMHDVVRDFAHWLTSKGDTRFMVKDGVKEWPNVVENFDFYTAIALWNCSCLNRFPGQVKFSKLKTLFLEGKNLQTVSSGVFSEMESLQVLFLKNVYFSLDRLQTLTNLRTLCCVECRLLDFSSPLKSMRNLEILALFYTNINEILEELVELSTLKSLYLSHDEERRIMSFPLSRLTSLQELHVTSENNIQLMDLNSLSGLTALSLRVSTNRHFPEDFVFPKLDRYVIVVNKDLDVWQGMTFRTLEINNHSSPLSAFKNLFYNVDKLWFEKVQHLTSLSLKFEPSSHAMANLQNLKTLTIENCHKLKVLFSPSLAQTMLHLQQLYVSNCDELEQLIGLVQQEEITEKPLLFSNLTLLHLKSLPLLESTWELGSSCHAITIEMKLKEVRIEKCQKLKVIFSPSLAQTMVHLQQLYVRNCDKLEQVIGFAQEEITENPYPLSFTKLKTMVIVNCYSLKYVFPTNIVSQGLSSLESVELKDCHRLIHVRPTDERDIIANPIVLHMPLLRKLWVEFCPRLTGFVVQSQVMEELYLENVGSRSQLCGTDVPMFNEDCMLVGNHDEVFRVEGEDSFSTIKELRLYYLSELQIIWKDLAGAVTLGNLTTLCVHACKKLRYIFTPSTSRSLSQLAYLDIMGCEELEEIILDKDPVSSSANAHTDLQPITFPNLTRVEVIDCNKLTSLFPPRSVTSLQKLTHLWVKGNWLLEQVFEEEDEVQVTTKEMKFEKLECLMLQGLHSLVDFCPKGYHFVFPVLRDLEVTTCPKISTSFSIDSNQIVHSKTQKRIEGSASETPPNIVHDKDICWQRGGRETLPHCLEE